MKVTVPGVFNKIEVWKVLELSGLASSTRKAQIFIRSGYVYKDGMNITSLKDMMDVGNPVLLSIRFPSGIVTEDSITVINQTFRTPTVYVREGLLDERD